MIIRTQIAVATFTVAFLLVPCDAHAQLEAIYDPFTGGVTFLGAETVVGIRVNSSSGHLVSRQATDLDGAASGALAVVNDQAPDFIEWGNLAGMTFDSASAGNIFPPGAFSLIANTEVVYRLLVQPTEDIQALFSCSISECGPGVVTSFPEPSSEISLQAAFNDGTGLLDNAIELYVPPGGPVDNVIDIRFAGSHFELFSATFNLLPVQGRSFLDLGIDVDAARQLPTGTPVSAELTVEVFSGELQYTLSAIVPEPSSIGLVSLAGTVCLIVSRPIGKE